MNGDPAKGVVVARGTAINLRTSPIPGPAVADTIRGDTQDNRFELQGCDGTQIGTIMASGLSAGLPSPSAPTPVIAGNNPILGGTGAFLGAKGEWEAVAIRYAENQ